MKNPNELTPIPAASITASRYRAAHFLNSVNSLAQLPPDTGREVAFAGRSNAGKSSALNVLTGQRQLARVSKTPGRTQLLNFFQVEPERYLVDLPGYGYAEVPVAVRKAWTSLLERYLKTRESLVGLVLIMDSRHPLTELDWNMIQWFAPTGKPIHILLTKADKLTRNAQAQALALVRRELADYTGQISVQLFSSLHKTGVDEVEHIVAPWLSAPHDTSPPVA